METKFCARGCWELCAREETHKASYNYHVSHYWALFRRPRQKPFLAYAVFTFYVLESIFSLTKRRKQWFRCDETLHMDSWNRYWKKTDWLKIQPNCFGNLFVAEIVHVNFSHITPFIQTDITSCIALRYPLKRIKLILVRGKSCWNEKWLEKCQRKKYIIPFNS